MTKKDNEIRGDDLVLRVNHLIKESFGKKFRGNQTFLQSRLSRGYRDLIRETEITGREPYVIIKSCFFGLTVKFVGLLGAKFDKINDGSVIAVFPEYKEKAKRYAELYEAEMGKEAEIILTHIVNPMMYPAELLFKKR